MLAVGERPVLKPGNRGGLVFTQKASQDPSLGDTVMTTPQSDVVCRHSVSCQVSMERIDRSEVMGNR